LRHGPSGTVVRARPHFKRIVLSGHHEAWRAERQVAMNAQPHRTTDQAVGPWAAIGAGIGMLFGLLSGAELPIALVLGAAVGLVVGVVVDSLTPPTAGDHDDAIRHPLTGF
jgi:hypothetical protein